MKLYCFGDSYSEGYKRDTTFPPYISYKNYLGVGTFDELPPVWVEILGNKLKCDYANYAKGGLSNHETLLTIAKHSHEFRNGDIVIINWTYTQRTTWVQTPDIHSDIITNDISSISPYLENSDTYKKYPKLKTTFETISIQRSHSAWVYETKNYEALIDELAKSVGFEVFYWYTDDILLNNMRKLKSLNERKYIINDLFDSISHKTPELSCITFCGMYPYGAINLYHETNGISDDIMHLGGVGHKVQAELFYSYITNTPYPDKIL